MAGPNLLEQSGARPRIQPTGAPLYVNRFFKGLYTQRNILRDPSGVVQEKWYGGGPDAFIDGENVEISNRLTAIRAPGSTQYSTATFPGKVNSFYGFRQFTTTNESITLMVDDATKIYTLNPTAKATVLTKANGAGPAFFIGVGNTLYIGDGAEQVAWTGVGTVRNWGIAALQAGAPGSAYAGTAADVPGLGTAWTNPTNAEGAPDAAYATSVVTTAGYNSTQTDFLGLTGYGFAVSGIILGITVKITGHVIVGAGANNGGVTAKLTLGGMGVGNYEGALFNSNVDFTVTLGGPGDLWGYSSWTPAAINGAGGLGVLVTFANNAAFTTNTFYVDGVEIIVTVAGPVVGTPTGSGTLTTVNGGWKYVYEYANSASGGFSSATPVGAATGNFSSKAYVGVPVVASADPQVNQIWVFRTLDGGATYFALPSNPYPNTTTTIQDSNLDASLLLTALADVTGLNTPPPSAFSAFSYYQGRIWGSVGNVVYYSSGPDLGNILGNGNEGVPPKYFFTFPSAIVRTVPITIAAANFSMLVVCTVSDIYAIYGNGSAAAALSGTGITPYFAAPLLANVGLADYNALDVRGGIIYMLTSDGRAIKFNPSAQTIYLDPEKAIDEIGFPIGAAPPGITLTGGTLASFTPSASYVTWHGAGSADQALYVADGSTGWFRCNTNTMPDGGAVWSCKRNILGGCSAVQSIETSPGVHQLLIGPPSSGGEVLFRDLTQNSDNGGAYEAFARIGAIVLAQPGQTAELDFFTFDFYATGSEPGISVLYDNLDTAFTTLPNYVPDPAQLVAASDVYNNRYYARQATGGTQGSAACRWLQLKVDFGNGDTVQNELLSFSIYGQVEGET